MFQQELATAERLDEGDALSAQEVVVVALESRVLLHRKDENNVARNRSRQLVGFTAQDNLLPMLHTLNMRRRK